MKRRALILTIVVVFLAIGTMFFFKQLQSVNAAEIKQRHITVAEKIEMLNTILVNKAALAKTSTIKITPKVYPMPPDPKLQPQSIPPYDWQIGALLNGPSKVNSLWIVGDKQDKYFGWNTAYAYSGSLKSNPDQGFIATTILDDNTNSNWSGVWNTPSTWGSVTITNVTGNIASFTTGQGIAGTFNLDTHEWKTQ